MHLTEWSALAWFWQDALAALVFGAIGLAIPRRLNYLHLALYGLLATWTAINIPVARAVFTPLTLPMLRAAGGPLADSIRLYVTPLNIALMLAVLVVASFLPGALQRLPLSASKWIALCAAAIVLLGPTARARANTHGMDRNVLFALAGGSLPTAPITHADRRTSASTPPAPEIPASDDLRRFSGSAKGFNIVMVGLESTAAQYLTLFNPGGNSNNTDVMPNLTGLAQKGLVFDNAYAVYPESIKGLFSVLCSISPAFNTQPDQYTGAGCRHVASALADAGYQTALFHSGRFDYLGMDSIIRHSGYQTLEDAGDIGGHHQSSFGVDEPTTVIRMLAWIDALPRDQPFFLTYLPIAGHHPYATPSAGPFPVRSPVKDEKDEIDQYRNALHYGDVSLGALVEGLRDRGLDRNTLWLIYGDHGEAFRQHEGNYGHTFFLYDENVHVPLLVAASGLINHIRHVRRVVSLVDVAPTILDLAGVRVPDNYEGRTVLDPDPRMALFFADYSLGFLGLRDGPWKFIAETRSSHAELYDLSRDPGETLNVAVANPAIAAAYTGVVRSWSAAQRQRILASAR
jgi:arylsulfatase A-like enzyme